jgi:hypothetical protein
MLLLRVLIFFLDGWFQAGASYRQRQDSREQAKKQHLIGSVEAIWGIHAADKGSYQQRLLTVNFDIKLLIFR